MIDAFSPSARLVIPRLLAKAQGTKIANQAGYYLHLGRWHKFGSDKPAPKGAPVMPDKPADKHSHISDEMWQAIHDAHPENSNKKTFSAKVEKMKAAYKAGDHKAILGMPFHADTTHKKLAHVANYVLGEMGSQHQVVVGQKTGEHAALKEAAVQSAVSHLERDQTEPDIPPAEKKEDAQAVQAIKEAPSTDAALDTAKQHMADDVADKVGDAAEHAEDKAELAKLEAAQTGLPADAKLDFNLSISGSPSAASNHVTKYLKDAGESADTIQTAIDALKKNGFVSLAESWANYKKVHFGTKPAEPNFGIFASLKGDIDEAIDKGDQQTLKDIEAYLTDRSNKNEIGVKEMLAHLHRQMAKVKPAAPKSGDGDKPPAPPKLKGKNYDAEIVSDAIAAKDAQTIQNVIGAYEGDAPNADEKAVLDYAKQALAYLQAQGVEQGPKDGDTKQGAEGTLTFKDGRWHKQAETPKPADPPGVEAASAPLPAQAGGGADLSVPAFQEGKTTTGVVEYYEACADKIISLAKNGDLASLEQFKSDGLKPNKKGKISNTWAGKTANSKLLLKLYDQAVAKLKDGSTPGTGEAAASALEKLENDIAGAGGAGKAAMLATQYVSNNNMADWAYSDAVDALQAAGYSKDAETLKKMKEKASAPSEPKKEPRLVLPKKREPSQAHEVNLSDFKTGAMAPTLSKKAFQGDNQVWHSQQKPADVLFAAGSTFNGEGAHENTKKVAEQIKAAKAAGYSVGYYKTSGLQAVYVFEKDGKLLTQAGAKALVEGGVEPTSPSSTARTPTNSGQASTGTKVKKGDAWYVKNSDGTWSSQYGDVGPEKNSSAAKELLAGYVPAKEWFENKGAIEGNKEVVAELALMDGADLQHVMTTLFPEAKVGDIKEDLDNGNDYQLTESGWAKLDKTAQQQKTFKLPGYGEYTKQPDGTWKSPSDGTAMIGSYQWALLQLASGGGLEGHPINSGMKMDVVLEAVKAGASPTKALNEVYPPNGVGGPQEGDTKVINGVTYQLINGRWHKVSKDAEAVPEPAAAGEPQPAADQHPLDAIPVPSEINNAPNKNWSQSALKSIEKLKAKLKDGNLDALKGATKFMSAGQKYIIKLPHFSDSDNYKDSVVTYKGTGQAAKALYDYVEALKAAAGKPTKKKAAPKPQPAATPTPSVFGNAPEPMDNWVQTGGQGGSNPGGKFKDPSGQEWYCKFPGDDDTAKSEVLAAKLYSLAGLASQQAKLITKGGKIGIASKWVDVKKAASPKDLAAVADAQAGFAVDAWLGNWDVVGLSYDNLQIGADGKAVRVDAGGSLEYRAQGAKKPFGNKVDELDTLRDKAKNPQAAAIFGSMTEADITASVAKVLKISDVAIRAMVNQFGPGSAEDKAKLADTLIARKKYLADKFPAAAKSTKKHTFKPEQVSAPPSFLNWGGSGKSGPSSKEFLNQANEAAVQSIYAAAKTGDIDAIKALKAPVYNKETGQITGEHSVLDHPSQHVKGYAQQAINEINYQLNPPKRFRFEGGHPLAALHAAYPAHPGQAASQAVQKLGKFLMLGEPGMVKLDDLQLPPKITHSSAGGSLTSSTYAAAAHAAFSKMPATQKQAIQSYTGSSYHEMNGSLWSGNPSGAAKAAGEALKTLGHDIAPGTVLSRKISIQGSDLDALLKSTGKVLQEPAIMSTSIRPSSWSGNVQLKLHVGPGVKGLWVGHGSSAGGGAVSKHAGEDEMILPPGTRLLVLGVKMGADQDGFGSAGMHVVEAVILPTT